MIATRKSLNPTQIHLLEMFDHCPTDGMMDELKSVLSAFYAQVVQREAIEKMLDEHWRTPHAKA